MPRQDPQRRRAASGTGAGSPASRPGRTLGKSDRPIEPANTRSPEKHERRRRPGGSSSSPGVWPGRVQHLDPRSPPSSRTSPSTIVRRSLDRASGFANPAPHAAGRGTRRRRRGGRRRARRRRRTSPAAPAWSRCAWVSRTATGVLPAASSIARTAPGSKPGSTTTVSRVPSAASNQQFVPYGLAIEDVEATCGGHATARPRPARRSASRGGVEHQRERTVVRELDLPSRRRTPPGRPAPRASSSAAANASTSAAASLGVGRVQRTRAAALPHVARTA